MKANDIVKQARERLAEIIREEAALAEERATLALIIAAAEGRPSSVTPPALPPPTWIPPIVPAPWPPVQPAPTIIPYAPLIPGDVTCGTFEIDASAMVAAQLIDLRGLVLGGPQRPNIHVGSA